MSKRESTQKKLQKVRPPRVQLTYDVHIGDAKEQKELPFVVGVLGDFSGQPNPDKSLPKIKDRKFVEVDRDNFDDVMKAMSPSASFRVKNKISDEGGEFGVELNFNKMEDFRPESVAQQVEPLKKLLEARTKLADLRNKLISNDRFEDLLGEVLNNTEKLKQLNSETSSTDSTE